MPKMKTANDVKISSQNATENVHWSVHLGQNIVLYINRTQFDLIKV